MRCKFTWLSLPWDLADGQAAVASQRIRRHSQSPGMRWHDSWCALTKRGKSPRQALKGSI